jgi:hypothetical protein
MTQEKKTIKAIKYLLSDIKKNGISKKHRHSEIDWDCAECRFRILEGGLKWYLGLLEFGEKLKNSNRLSI